MVPGVCVGGFEVGLLCPARFGPYENISRARIRSAGVAWVTVYTGRVTGLPIRADHDSFAGNGYRSPEREARCAIEGFEVSLTIPVGPNAHEDIGRAGIWSA